MKYIWHRRQQPDLLVYFAGWGTPPSVIAHLGLPDGYDVLICYDYRDLELAFDFAPYRNIRVVAWSLGVWVAERVLDGYSLLSATAINGTANPCDAQYGIPPAIFTATLAGLTPHSRQKFERRMCGKGLSGYQQRQDQRRFDELHAELTALFYAICNDTRTDLLAWTHAIIGTQDKIFPAQNQHAYWANRCAVRTLEGEHYLLPAFSRWDELWT